MKKSLASPFRTISIAALAAGMALSAAPALGSSQVALLMSIGGDNPSAVDEALDTILCSTDFSADGCQLARLLDRKQSDAGRLGPVSAPQAMPEPAPQAIEPDDEEYVEEEEGGC